MVQDKQRQFDRQNRWTKENRTRLSILVDNSKGEKIRLAASASGISINQYVNQAINEKLQRDHEEKKEDNTACTASKGINYIK